MYKCLRCDKKIPTYPIFPYPRYFVVPDILPNEYYLCDEHKDLSYMSDDIYEFKDEKYYRREIDHQKVIDRLTKT